MHRVLHLSKKCKILRQVSCVDIYVYVHIYISDHIYGISIHMIQYIVLTIYLLKYIRKISGQILRHSWSFSFWPSLVVACPIAIALLSCQQNTGFVEAAMCRPRGGVTMNLNQSRVSFSSAHGGSRDRSQFLSGAWEMRGSLLRASRRISLLRKQGCAWGERSFCF